MIKNISLALFVLLSASLSYSNYISIQQIELLTQEKQQSAQENQTLTAQNLTQADQLRDLVEQVAKQQAQIAQLKTKNTQLLALPVSVSYRSAMLGPGLVAKFSTDVKKTIVVAATFENPSIGRRKTLELHISPRGVTEVGHAEGVVLENGDIITLENSNYTKATYTVQY